MNFQTKYQWYAIYTRSRYEKKLFKLLQQKDIECYLPLKVESKQWSDRVKKVEEPLLKGYLFVKVSNKEYYEALNTLGAVRYVTFNGKAAPIPEKQIEDLKLFLEHYNQKLDVTMENLERGEKVEIKVGVLQGVQGEIVELRGKSRIVLRFSELGYCVHTEIQLKDVKKLS